MKTSDAQPRPAPLLERYEYLDHPEKGDPPIRVLAFSDGLERALSGAGLTTVGAIILATDTELCRVRGIGPGKVSIIRDAVRPFRDAWGNAGLLQLYLECARRDDLPAS